MSVELGSAYISLSVSSRGLGKDIARQFGAIPKSADKAGKEAGRSFGGGFGGTVKGVLGAAAIFAGIAKGVGFLKSANAEARESQKVGAVTTAIIKSTGGAANVSAKQMGDLTTAISLKSGVDDEAIQSGANLLLTFKNVKNEAGAGSKIFDRATQSAVDLSAAGFGSVTSASKQLGKALNDPIKGTAALGKAGVTFTDQQKKQIKTLVESGHTLGAQKIILGEVESQVGGVAAASATMGEKLTVAFGNFKEQVGTALLPVVDGVANLLLTKVLPALGRFVTFLSANAPAALATIKKALAPAIESVRLFFDLLRGKEGSDAGFSLPWAGIVIKAAFGVLGAFDKVRFFISGTMIPTLQLLGDYVKIYVLPALSSIGSTLVATFHGVVGFIKKDALPTIRLFFDLLRGKDGTDAGFSLPWAQTVISAAFGVLGAFDKVRFFISGTLLPTFSLIGTYIKVNVLPALIGIGRSLLATVLPQVKAVAGFLAQNFIPAVTAIGGAFKKYVLPVLSQLATFVIGTLIPNITQIRGAVVTAILPSLIRLGQFVLNTLVPALSKVALFILSNIVPAFRAVSAFVMANVIPALGAIARFVVDKVVPGLFAIGAAVAKLAKVVIPIVAQIVAAVVGKFNQLKPQIMQIWGSIQGIVTGALELIRAIISRVTKIISFVWSHFGGTILSVIKIAFGNLVGIVGGALKILRGVIKVATSLIQGNWSGVWDGIKQIVSGAFAVVKSVAKAALGVLKALFGGVLESIRKKVAEKLGAVQARFTEAKNWVVNKFSAAWAAVKGVLTSAVSKAKDELDRIWGRITGKFTSVKNWVVGAFKREWNGLKLILTDPVQAGHNIVDNLLGKDGKVRGIFNSVVKWAKSVFKTSWAGIEAVFTDPVGTAKGSIDTILGKILEAFSGFVTASGKALDKLKGKFSSPVDWILKNVFPNIRRAYNSIAKLVGLPLLPDLTVNPNGGRNQGRNSAQSSGGGYARGGVVDPKRHNILPGRSRWQDGDSMVASVRPGEGWTVSEALADPYERARLLGLNKAALRGESAAQFRERFAGGFARGGVIWPVPGHRTGTYPGHSGVDINRGSGNQDLGDPIRAAQGGRVVYAGFGHGYGRGIFIDTTSGFQNIYGHTSAAYVRAGQQVSTGQLIGRVGNTGNSSAAHLHFGVKPGLSYASSMRFLRGSSGFRAVAGGALDAIKSFFNPKQLFAKAAGKLLDGISNRLPEGHTPFGRVIAALPRKLIAGIKAKLPASTALDSDTASGPGLRTGKAGQYSGANFGAAQLGNAATIASVGSRMGRRAVQIGLMTAMQESTLRNLSGGDRDSVGLFQQRAPWGPFSARHNPRTSAGMFFHGGRRGQRGLDDIPGWRGMSLGRAAQKVQVSAYPGAYAKWAGAAAAIMSRNGYDNGGMLKPGMNLAVNGTGKPERVLTDKQWKILADNKTRPAAAGAAIVYNGPITVADERTFMRAQDEAIRRREILSPNWMR